MPLTEENALVRLRIMVAATNLPTLDDEQMTYLLDLARRADLECRPPTDDEWIPTWDLNYAAAEGWSLKAGKAAGGYDVVMDGQQLRRSQIYSNCIVQRNRYRAKIAASPRAVAAPVGEDRLVLEEDE